jgi:hypothetical protein
MCATVHLYIHLFLLNFGSFNDIGSEWRNEQLSSEGQVTIFFGCEETQTTKFIDLPIILLL